MLHVNSVALLTVLLNLVTRVPLLANLRLRFVGAENHNRDQGTALRCRSEVPPEGGFSFMVTFVSVIHSWSHKKSSVTQLTLSMMTARIVCTCESGSLLRPSHGAALVYIHMDAAKYDPTHVSSILLPCPLLPSHKRRWPSALPRRVAAHTVPCLHRCHICLLCGLAKICSTLTPSLSWHKGSYHGTDRSCHSNIPSDLLSPSTFPVLWSESVTQNMPQHLNCHVSEWESYEWRMKMRTNFMRASHKRVLHQRSPAAWPTDTLPHCDSDVTNNQKA